MTATISRIRLLSSAAEQLIGPLLVFVISYAHHIYFVNNFVSSSFAAFSLLSLLLVMAVDKTGILLALGLQCAFLGWVAIAEPYNLFEQALFSLSISLSLFASYINCQDVTDIKVVQPSPQDAQVLIDQKEKLWQELFDARQEIKSLYEQKQQLQTTFDALQATVETSSTAELKEKEAQIQLLHHQLESVVLEKQQFVEERAACEEDIKKFASHMHEMALYQETLRQEILRLEELREKEKQTTAPVQETAAAHTSDEKPTHYETLWRQLKQQFDEKSKILDAARKDLFLAQDEIVVLKKLQEENLEPSTEEQHLMQQLVAYQDKIDALSKAHDEELVGYEEVIQGLLNQLHEKQTV